MIPIRKWINPDKQTNKRFLLEDTLNLATKTPIK